jgi:hypothetical protein
MPLKEEPASIVIDRMLPKRPFTSTPSRFKILEFVSPIDGTFSVAPITSRPRSKPKKAKEFLDRTADVHPQPLTKHAGKVQKTVHDQGDIVRSLYKKVRPPLRKPVVLSETLPLSLVHRLFDTMKSPFWPPGSLPNPDLFVMPETESESEMEPETEYTSEGIYIEEVAKEPEKVVEVTSDIELTSEISPSLVHLSDRAQYSPYIGSASTSSSIGVTPGAQRRKEQGKSSSQKSQASYSAPQSRESSNHSTKQSAASSSVKPSPQRNLSSDVSSLASFAQPSDAESEK